VPVDDGVRRRGEALQVVDERGAVAGRFGARQIGAHVAVERGQLRELVRIELAQAARLHHADQGVEPVPFALATPDERGLRERGD